MFHKKVIESRHNYECGPTPIRGMISKGKTTAKCIVQSNTRICAIKRRLGFVEIINDSREHRTVLSDVKVDNIETEIEIYDNKRLNNAKNSLETKNAILKLMAHSDRITIDVLYVSQQDDADQ